jgi:hypothetical protein
MSGAGVKGRETMVRANNWRDMIQTLLENKWQHKEVQASTMSVRATAMAETKIDPREV